MLKYLRRQRTETAIPEIRLPVVWNSHKFRDLHIQMDDAVLEAYGWTDLNIYNDFYEVDYLPENDRVRFTIHPEARREILKRLLELNHKIHAQGK
jgi:hypothetical protein